MRVAIGGCSCVIMSLVGFLDLVYNTQFSITCLPALSVKFITLTVIINQSGGDYLKQ